MVRVRTTGNKNLQTGESPTQAGQLGISPPPPPNFEILLGAPLVNETLPIDFNLRVESAHLAELWSRFERLREFDFEEFIHAGGSGMVFRVRKAKTKVVQALKIARSKLIRHAASVEKIPDSLSPVSERELRALEKISHPNVVRLFDAIPGPNGKIIAIATTYVEDPKPLDTYLRETLGRIPSAGSHAFSPKRLDRACDFLLERCLEVAHALDHMHKVGIYHFDIKPANILISSKRNSAVLTDLGASVHSDDLPKAESVRANFTWTYAHPSLTSMAHQPASITGGGLKASAEVKTVDDDLCKYDLFAFGRTIQEALGILELEFGERAYAAYGFRFLHLIGSLLLDGQNAPSSGNRLSDRDERKFVSDTALDYPVELFRSHKIKSAEELCERLRRYSREFSWHRQIPELDPSQPRLLNTGIGDSSPFTERVERIASSAALRRLKNEAQLGWIREVFPGATHNRWSHTIGVFGFVTRYYSALLQDPDVPTLRVLLDEADVAHAMIAALIHDLGQVSFGHDLEAASPHLFRHEAIVGRLLSEQELGGESLGQVIKNEWPEVKIDRVQAILGRRSTARPVDGLAEDIIDGPIDADKLDYLLRDAAGCGVSYGAAIDPRRFLQALTVDARKSNDGCKLALAYRAKGLASVEAVLLARYQMYGAVYWHHTFRCIQAMFTHAAAATLGPLSGVKYTRKLRDTSVSPDLIRDLLYQWVVCGKSIKTLQRIFGQKLPVELLQEVPQEIRGERAIEFVWRFSNDRIRKLLQRLSRRDIYKRVFEVKIGDIADFTDYSAFRAEMTTSNRSLLADQIERNFLAAIQKSMADRGPRETQTENRARSRYQELASHDVPRIVLDFPMRGIPEETNFPVELGDSARKYTGSRTRSVTRGKVFKVVKDLQCHRAAFRVYAAPELHELIVRYLDPATVEACVAETVKKIRAE